MKSRGKVSLFRHNVIFIAGGDGLFKAYHYVWKLIGKRGDFDVAIASRPRLPRRSKRRARKNRTHKRRTH